MLKTYQSTLQVDYVN